MTTADDLTANAYLKLRDKVAETLSDHGAHVYSRESAERLIQAGYINIDAVLNLP
ncbi:hypothetical protein SEA_PAULODIABOLI_252 [Microbacterium phage PauloDiaboli]|nr:hypothetical protein SEA_PAULODIABOLI_252 [Microbacterium phage PauloDiaboli]QWY84059.1 hypothetical protein SEA_A3WALLY_252 [Microbacterium phage A3Wally]